MNNHRPILESERQAADCQMRSMAVMFTDMAGSSKFAEKFGARAAFQKRKRHNALIVPLIDLHRGKLVEVVGDSLLAVFESSADATHCAVAMQQRLAEYNRSDEIDVADLEIHIRIGLHKGKLIVCRHGEQIEVAGRAVNIGARVEASNRKKTDQILISDTVAFELADDPEFSTRPLAHINAKGIGRLQVHHVLWREQASVVSPQLPEPIPRQTRPLVLSASTAHTNAAEPKPRQSVNVRACHGLLLDLQNHRGYAVPVWVRLQPRENFRVKSHVDCDEVMSASTERAVRSAFAVLRDLGFSGANEERHSVEWWVGDPDVRYEGASLGLAFALAAAAAYTGLYIDPRTAVTGAVDSGRIVPVAGVPEKWDALRALGTFGKLIVPPGNLADLPASADRETNVRVVAAPTVASAVAEVLGTGLGLAPNIACR